MKFHSTFLGILSFAFFLTACQGCRESKPAEYVDYSNLEEQLIEQNKQRLKAESESIDRFVEEKGWPVTQTGTGVRYWIYEDAKGVDATNNDIVLIHVVVSLLDGTECFSTAGKDPITFKVGMDDVASGLHEAIQFMSPGDKAMIVLPSHRAWGFTGDQNKIPQNATLVYDLELIDVG